MNKRIALYRDDLRQTFERMHDLLACGMAKGGLSSEAKLLSDSLKDFLDARTDSDRKVRRGVPIIGG